MSFSRITQLYQNKDLSSSFLLLSFAVMLACSLLLTQGQFVFSLDDAYIHLSLAENIQQGHYGINTGEYANPSSSVLWAWLLTPFASLRFVAWIILLANLGFTWLAIRCIHHFYQTEFSTAIANSFTLFFLIAANMLAMIFTGLEHSLQLLLAIFVSITLLQSLSGEKPSAWFWLALCIGPLIRFENAILSLVAALYFMYSPALCLSDKKIYRLYAVTAGLLCLSVIGAQTIFFEKLGLPPLPSSIMAKTASLTSHEQSTAFSFLASLSTNIQENLSEKGGLGLLVIMFMLANKGLRAPDKGTRFLSCLFLLAGFLHFCFFRFGWMGRYELYLFIPAVIFTSWLYQSTIKTIATKPWAFISTFIILITSLTLAMLLGATSQLPLGFIAALAALFIILAAGQIIYLLIKHKSLPYHFLYAGILSGLISLPYAMIFPILPFTSQNIYLQQVQSARFIQDYYQGPVAVNDIGLVSKGNPHYVLDLWGLASLEALALRKSEGNDLQWMDDLVQSKHIPLVMIYRPWFEKSGKKLPDNWQPVAKLLLTNKLALIEREVYFFHTQQNPVALSKLQEDLRQFKTSLPEQSSLIIF